MTAERRFTKYKLVSGNSLTDLEERVNFFLKEPANRNFSVHGDIQMYSYTTYVQTLVGSELTND